MPPAEQPGPAVERLIKGYIAPYTVKEIKVKENIIDYREQFINKLIPYKLELGNEYENFLMYWTESDKNVKLRYEL